MSQTQYVLKSCWEEENGVQQNNKNKSFSFLLFVFRIRFFIYNFFTKIGFIFVSIVCKIKSFIAIRLANVSFNLNLLSKKLINDFYRKKKKSTFLFFKINKKPKQVNDVYSIVDGIKILSNIEYLAWKSKLKFKKISTDTSLFFKKLNQKFVSIWSKFLFVLSKILWKIKHRILYVLLKICLIFYDDLQKNKFLISKRKK